MSARSLFSPGVVADRPARVFALARERQSPEWRFAGQFGLSVLCRKVVASAASPQQLAKRGKRHRTLRRRF